MKIRRSHRLNCIADDVDIGHLYQLSDASISAYDVADESIDKGDLADMAIARGVDLASKVARLNAKNRPRIPASIWVVEANEAVGESLFYFVGTETEVAKKLRRYANP